MEEVSDSVRLESTKSLQSAIRKSENALEQMTQKAANVTLLRHRLQALSVGLALLESVWQNQPHSCSREEIAEARRVLAGLLPSLERSYAKLKAGSPQRTLLERRMKALELAVQAMDDLA
ncbi:hypothetical protein [Gorillibacterium sp. sgz500922]|uniref:hypothetical protein n=1 Tax=Gorillibacterium sp. sgz500922 TaxID=3446694 RepID=UPI003F67C495